MDALNLRAECRRAFTSPEVANEVNGSLLYLDFGAGEVAHCSLGLPFLYSLGARAVFSLEDASLWDQGIAGEGGSPVKKVVVITTRALSDSHRHILKLLLFLHGSSVQFFSVFTIISEEAHESYSGTPLPLPDGSGGAYTDYENLLLQDFLEASKNIKKNRISESVHLTETQAQKPPGEKQREEKQKEEKQREEHGFGWTRERNDEHRFPRTQEASIIGGEKKNEILDDNRENRPILGGRIEVKISHLPLLGCMLTPTTFIAPAGSTIAEAPLAERGTFGPSLPSLGNSILETPSEKLPAGVILTAHWLMEMSADLGWKLDFFGLGPTARAMARLMVNLHPSGNFQPARQNAALVLVDRSLDLLTPSCHHDTFFDKALTFLPHTPSPVCPKLPSSSLSVHSQRQAVGVRVIVPEETPLRTSDLMGWWTNEVRQDGFQSVNPDLKKNSFRNGVQMGLTPMGGSLFHPTDPQTMSLLDRLMGMRVKESALLVRKLLREALTREGKAPSKPRLGGVTYSEIMGLVHSLISTPKSRFRNIGLIELSCGVTQILNSERVQTGEALASIEKLLLLSGGEVGQNLGPTLMDLISQNKRGGEREGVDVKDILTLAVLGYALVGENLDRYSDPNGSFLNEEFALKEKIVEVIMTHPPSQNLGFLEGLGNSLEYVWERRTRERESLNRGSGTERVTGLNNKGTANEEKVEAKELERSSYREGNGENDEKEDTEEAEGWEGEGEWGDPDGWEGDERESVENDVNGGSENGEAEDKGGGEGEAWGDALSDMGEEEREREREYSETAVRLDVRDRVDDVFERLHFVAKARSGMALKKMGGMPEEGGEREREREGGEMAKTLAYRPLVKQLASRILSRSEVPGLEHVVSGVGGFLKTGLGRLGLAQSKVRPGDNSTIILFVIGGIAPVEIRDVKEAQLAVPGANGVELILGSTNLLTPSGVHDALFTNCGAKDKPVLV